MVLEQYRQQIDEIDQQLTRLFEERMKLVVEVGEYKKQNGLPIFHADRERQVLEKNASYLSDDRFRQELIEFYKALMGITKSYQQKIVIERYIVGYQGVEGSFSHIALGEIFAAQRQQDLLDTKHYQEFEDVFKALKDGDIKYGILPIENSSTGSINQNYDYLHRYNCYIISEHLVRAEQNLLAVPGATLDSVKQVYSHPQGFEQSVKFLSKFKDWDLMPYYNTAISAQYVHEQNDPKLAAIASKEAAKKYGLNILAEDINDNKKNFTRFIQIGNDLEYDESSNKISIIFSIPNRAGTLFKVMENIAQNGINMLMLESRPIPEKSWEYLFYLDIEGNLEEERIQRTLAQIEKNTSYYKLLGCYKREAM